MSVESDEIEVCYRVNWRTNQIRAKGTKRLLYLIEIDQVLTHPRVTDESEMESFIEASNKSCIRIG